MLPVQSFQNFIAQHQLFQAKQPVLLAVSGGRDSVLMAYLFKQAGFNFGIAHCNFGLRAAEADADEQFTAQLAQSLDVPFYRTTFNTQTYARQQGISIQMAARQLRYQWFEQIRQQFNYQHIAVAHHQNDSVETILLNLTRGTGIAGMHGILPKNGFIIRPLLFLTRQEVDAIVATENIPYVEDSSNASVKYARNKIRLQVIPLLKELNPALEQTFNNNLKRFRDMETLLINTLQTLKASLLQFHHHDVHISIDAIKALHPQRLLLNGLLSPYGFNETSTDDLIASLDKHAGRTFESATHLLLLDRDHVIIIKRNQPMLNAISVERDSHSLNFGSYKLTLLHDDSPLIARDNPMATSVDAGKLIFPLTLRTWHQGDHFFPLGMKGSKKLSDFFVNEKLPLHKKNEVPVLVNGNDELIWICGYRLDDRYKVNAHTKKVVIFELFNLSQ